MATIGRFPRLPTQPQLTFRPARRLACHRAMEAAATPTPPPPRLRADRPRDHRAPGGRRRARRRARARPRRRRRGSRAADRRRDRDRRAGARPRAGRRLRRGPQGGPRARVASPWCPSSRPSSSRPSGPTTGTSTRVLERHFGADSSSAVQHQVRAAVAELLSESREKLFKQFSSADESNPLATFQKAAVAAIRQSSDQQHTHLREMNGRIAELQLELQKLQAERAKAAEVAAEHDRSTAKGRPYEEAVFEAIDAIASAQGDDCDAVGDLRGAGGRKGDVVVDLDGCSGRPRGRIVFEAKNSKRSRNEALAELDEAMNQRAADYAVWVVPAEDKLPARSSGAARDQRRQAVRGLRPRGGLAAGARGRLLAGPGARGDGQGRRRRARRLGPARRGRARDGGDGGRAPDQEPAHERRQPDRGRAHDRRRHGRARPRPPRADRRDGRRRRRRD